MTKTPTTAAERQARSKQRLRAAGGRRLAVNLSPSAADALARVMQHHRITTAAAAIEWALIQQSKGCPPVDKAQPDAVK